MIGGLLLVGIKGQGFCLLGALVCLRAALGFAWFVCLRGAPFCMPTALDLA
jgi:hypothetical protein